MKLTHLSVVAGISLAMLCNPLLANAADATPTAPNMWQSSIAAGATLTRGNSETFLGTLSGAAGKKWDQNELAFGADTAYGTTRHTVVTDSTTTPPTTVERDQTTASTLHGFGQYNRLYNERFYGYGRIEALHDDVADIDYRLSLNLGAGYYFIKNNATQFSAEVGPGYILQRLGGQGDNYVTFRAAEKLNQALSDRSRLWESAEILPQVDKPKNFIVNFEIGVEADLNSSKSMSLRVYLDDTYNNVPAAGRKKNDLKLVAAVAYKF